MAFFGRNRKTISTDLSNNMIKSIDSNLQELNNLRSLNLSKNLISQLQADAFSRTPNLVYLYLRKNCLKSINENQFQGLNKLLELDLSNNFITNLESNSFKDLNNLQILKG